MLVLVSAICAGNHFSEGRYLQLTNLIRRARGLWPVFFILPCYLYGLASFPFIGPDEPRYAQVAREMWLRRDLVTTTLGGKLWFEKPALPYWLTMAGYELFGVHEWSARLGYVICGLLATLALYILGQKIDQLSPALQSENQSFNLLGANSSQVFALIFVTCAGTVAFSRGINFDIVVTMTITLGLVSFFISDVAENKYLWLVGFYVSLGLALLAKGLIGIILPGGILFFYFVLRRSWPSRQFLISLWWGGALTLLIASLWYGPVIYRHGWFFIDQFFIQHHFARYVSNKYHHPQPFYFYPPVITLMVFPWLVFLIASIVGSAKWNWKSAAPKDRLRVLAFAWLLFPVVFFSFSVSKLPGYILPALPAAAILAADLLLTSPRKSLQIIFLTRITGAILLIASAGGFIYLWRFERLQVLSTLVIALPILVAGLITMLVSKNLKLIFNTIFCAVLLSSIVTLKFAASTVTRSQSVKYLLQEADARGFQTTPVMQFAMTEHSSSYYAESASAGADTDHGRLEYEADGTPVRFDDVTKMAWRIKERGGSALILAPLNVISHLTLHPMLDSEVIGDNGETALVAVKVRPSS